MYLLLLLLLLWPKITDFFLQDFSILPQLTELLFYSENQPIIILYVIFVRDSTIICKYNNIENVFLVPHAQGNDGSSIEILIILLCRKYRTVYFSTVNTHLDISLTNKSKSDGLGFFI